jgi:alpha-N-acetylglucosaminidase
MYHYERNILNLITLWGNKDCRIKDYACRQWNGMMSGFYRPRWERFFAVLEDAISRGVQYDELQFVSDSKDWEWDWVSGKEKYATETCSDEIVECLRIWNAYFKDIARSQDNFEYEAEIEAYV